MSLPSAGFHCVPFEVEESMIVPANSSGIRTVVAEIRRGGVVAFPTETSYGVGADPFNGEAIAHVAHLKGRDGNKPAPVLISEVAQAQRLVEKFTDMAAVLAEHFWPGPLTLVLGAKAGLLPGVLGPNGTVAIRVSSHPVTQMLVQALGSPLTATSANQGGQPAALTAVEAHDYLAPAGLLNAVLDGGPVPGGASTIVVCTGQSPGLIREGAVPFSEIRKVLLEQLGVG